MKLNKYIILLLKSTFLLIIFYLIYNTIIIEKGKIDYKLISERVDYKTYLYIVLVMVLQLLNWFIEALKFKFIINKKQSISTIDAIKSVYVGNATAFLTPDRFGNFIGRFIYLNQLKKTFVTSSTLLGNFAQLITTMTFALIATILIATTDTVVSLPFFNWQTLMICTFTLWVILTYLYFNPAVYLKIILKIKWINNRAESVKFLLEMDRKESLKIMIYSILRYLVFILQFYTLFIAFETYLTYLDLIIFSGLLYLFTTLIPSPLLGNLGTREYISILLLSQLTYPEVIIMISLAIWIINIVIPSLIGSYLMFKLNTKTL